MGLMIWSSPPVQVGVGGGWTSRAAQYCTQGYVNFIPSQANGTPATDWCVTFGRAPTWTTALADPLMTPLFPPSVSNSIQSPQALVQVLRNNTINDLTAGQRSALTAFAELHDIPHADFGLSTPMWRVYRRIVGRLMMEDEGFTASITF